MGISSYLKVLLEQLRNLDMSPLLQEGQGDYDRASLRILTAALEYARKESVPMCPDHSQDFLLLLYPSSVCPALGQPPYAHPSETIERKDHLLP